MLLGMPPRENRELTTTQALVYGFYTAHLKEHGAAPTVLFMASELELQRSTIYQVLGRLEEKGYLKKNTAPRFAPTRRRAP